MTQAIIAGEGVNRKSRPAAVLDLLREAVDDLAAADGHDDLALQAAAIEGGGKFKLKPKVPAAGGAAAPAAGAVPVPALVVPAAAMPVPSLPPPPAADGVPKAPPPFPVMAPPASGKTTPPIPHMALKTVAVDAPPPGLAKPKIKPKKSLKVPLLAAAALVVLGGGGFFGWMFFMQSEPAPPPPLAIKPKAPVPAAPAAAPAAKSAPAPAQVDAGTPSEALNKLAHAPANAIQMAQDAISARRESGQGRVDSALAAEDLGNKPAQQAVPATPAMTGSTGTRSVAPGLTATIEVNAVAEASLEFRSFVANARVSGVFQGAPSRAFINGRLTRAGETVEANLGIVFEAVDAETKQLIFRDKSGAFVSRRY